MINPKSRSSTKIAGACGLLSALAAMFLSYNAAAQALAEAPQRWLLVFDTSLTMKGWLPSTTTELQNLFVTSMGGQLHTGDSIGVWTFSKKLRADKYPLFTWDATQASSDASDLNDFLDRQTYLGRTSFAAIEPALKNVIARSQRLTIVIFCDGGDMLKLTPYDDGINRVLKQMKASREKARVCFALVVRTQNGEFVGATVNLPPGNLDLPPFPPLPEAPVTTAPAAPPAPPVVAPPPPAAPAPPPLVIVGTNVVTNPDQIKKDSGP
jgi:hypothetical protein